MKLVYFRTAAPSAHPDGHSRLSPGLATEKGVIDIDAWLQANGRPPYNSPFDLPLLKEIAENPAGSFPDAASSFPNVAGKSPAVFLDESTLNFGPCVAHPSKIICIGLNYRQHAIESGMAIPTIPVVFTKYANTLVDYGGAVPLGPVGVQFDYEVELGVVIGKRCKAVRASDALDYVLGYCVANDLSCRDLQFRTSQWLMGKSLDHFLPLGKYLVTKDEIADPQRLQLRCTLNGETRQDSNTADMVFSVAEIIEDLSKHMTLEPGDLILTGTPQGVIMGMAEKNWLKPGDIVTVEITGLGSTTNTMVS